VKQLTVVAVALWLGAMGFFAFVVAPAILARSSAGRGRIGRGLPLLRVGPALGLAALAGLGARWMGARGAAGTGCPWASSCLLALTLYAGAVVLPAYAARGPSGRPAWIPRPQRVSRGSTYRHPPRHRDGVGRLVLVVEMGAPGGEFEPSASHFIVLRVGDQSPRYTEVLGCTVDHFNERISLLQLRFGEHLIDLLPGTPSSEGLDHVCLSVRCGDLGAARDALAARGVRLEGDVVERRGAYGTGPSLYLRDPDGYLIELKPR
jgi:catechol 2,3-dioxygenase-like lactoylglutathione lyase family enzyme